MFESNLFEIEEFKLSEFDKIKPFPGVYSWHAYINNAETPDKLESYNRFYGASSFKANIEGYFSFSYNGTMNRNIDGLDLNNRHYDTNLCEYITKSLAPPIYIGIARTSLKTRLQDHLSQFSDQQILNRDPEEAEKLIYEQSNLKDSEIDTSEESGFFALRLAFLMNQSGIEQDNIFVRTYVYKKTPPLKPQEKTLIKDLEFLLNRTYRPILGRK